MTGGENSGSFTEETFWRRLNVVRRRDAFSVAPIAQASPSMDKLRSVRVAGGTKEVIFYDSAMDWIGRPPAEQGAAFGKQLATDMFNDMLSVGLTAHVAAISAKATNYLDVTGSATEYTASLKNLLSAAALFGDQNAKVNCWVMNSKCAFDILGQNLTNANNLFSYGSVNVARDPQGRPIVITDHPSLVTVGTPNKYFIAGLVPGAILIEDNRNYRENLVQRNGKEQIETSWQAEWDFNLSLKGHQWDATAGGASPSTAALGTATNWVFKMTDFKDAGGVLLRVK
jgi:hypothetical protein